MGKTTDAPEGPWVWSEELQGWTLDPEATIFWVEGSPPHPIAVTALEIELPAWASGVSKEG